MNCDVDLDEDILMEFKFLTTPTASRWLEDFLCSTRDLARGRDSTKAGMMRGLAWADFRDLLVPIFSINTHTTGTVVRVRRPETRDKRGAA